MTSRADRVAVLQAELDAASNALAMLYKSPELEAANHRYLVAFEMLRAFNEAQRHFKGSVAPFADLAPSPSRDRALDRWRKVTNGDC